MPWSVVANTQVLAVHAALLPTGHILLFSGDEHDEDQAAAGQIDHTRLFDCATNAVSPVGSPSTDVFCSGHALVTDGRVVVAGGTAAFPHHTGGIHAPHFPGLRETWTFNPRSRAWTQAAPMNPEPGLTTGGGRWYPTLLTLANGQVLALSGHPREDDSRHENDSPEVWSASPRPTGTWRLIGPADDAHGMTYYPRAFVLPDGDVFIASPVGAMGSTRLRPSSNTWIGVTPSPADDMYDGFATPAVLLPLRHDQGYRPRVMMCGASQPVKIDLGAASPAWTNTGPRALAGNPVRNHANAVLLPNGQVFVCGGTQDPASDATGVLAGELYDPETDHWSVADSATVVRNYHSVALLMPDGRVWTAGSNIGAQQSFPPTGGDQRELRVEVYSPPYVTASRPQITSAPATVGWGQAFDVRTTQADQISRVVLIRAGTSTHAFDPDQRYVTMDFRHISGEWLDVKAPPNSSVAPHGYYLMFTVNQAGVPSQGRFVRLSPRATSSGYLVQSSFGRKGNFEAVTPRAGGGIKFGWRNNDAPGLPWSAPTDFLTGAGELGGVPSLIQSNYGSPGNLEMVARIGQRLAHFWRDGAGWHGPGFFADGVSGNPALIQGIFGGRGNFEVVAPLAAGGLAHWWRNNDAPGAPWNGPTPFGAGAGHIDAVAMIQSNFGDPGNLEVVARIGNQLALFWRLSEPPWTWTGPLPFFTGAQGVPSFVQAHFGARGNFELVTPREGGGLVHMWRNNDAAGLPWSPASAPFGGPEVYDSVSMIESNFGNPGPGGNLEMLARAAGTTRFFWRADIAPWAWAGAGAPAI
jgi:hypothetical protein